MNKFFLILFISITSVSAIIYYVYTSYIAVQDRNTQIQIPVNKYCDFVVTKVIDGDTIEAKKCTNTGCNIYSIRYLGIDTPEIHRQGYPMQYMSVEAYNINKELLHSNNICIETKEYNMYDKYNRLLAYVFNQSGSLINIELLKRGLARFADYNDYIKYTAEFLSSQKQAQINSIGIWNNKSLCAYNDKYEKIHWDDINKYVGKYITTENEFTYFETNNYNIKYFNQKNDNKYIVITHKTFNIYFNTDQKDNKNKFINKKLIISGVVKKSKDKHYIEIITPWDICIK